MKSDCYLSCIKMFHIKKDDILDDSCKARQIFLGSTDKKKGGSSALPTFVGHLECCIVPLLPVGEGEDLLQRLL